MKTRKVVIADDDRDLVRALELRCLHLGLEVCTAHDAMTALNLIHQHHPDLVCLDVNMPAGNGLSVCEMIQADEALASTAVVMLTGQSDEDTIRRCHSMCAYYVQKSDNVWERLEPIICELLELTPTTPDTIGGEGAHSISPMSRRGLAGLCEVLASEKTSR